MAIIRVVEQTDCSQLAKTLRRIRSLIYKFTGLLIDTEILSYNNDKEVK